MPRLTNRIKRVFKKLWRRAGAAIGGSGGHSPENTPLTSPAPPLTINDYEMPHRRNHREGPHKTTHNYKDQPNGFKDEPNDVTEVTLREMAVDGTRHSIQQPPDEASFPISGGMGGDGGGGGISGGGGGTGEGPTLGARNIMVKPVFHNLVEQPSAVLQASLLAVPHLAAKLVDQISRHIGRSDSMTLAKANEFLLEALRIASFVYSFRIAEFAYTQIVLPRLASFSGGDPRRPGLLLPATL
ncbi:hypothetical protein C8R45DRAFT_1040378 [Mycena sanguinolenta]|nr:hypothetical protein C8R45DRAFT_1040378 [Mycena sanguinolenta]